MSKVITCTGFYGTGSSAITNLMSEFDNCCSLGEYEFRFIQEPNGIRDLEYNIVENNHRHNTSNAIKQFIKYTRYLNGDILRKGYRRYWGDYFLKATKKYLDNICELDCETWWNYDQFQKGAFFNDLDLIYKGICNKLGFLDRSILTLLGEKGYYSAISREDFYYYTQEYISDLFNYINKTDSDYIMLDQLVPPVNIEQYLHYFKEDIKVIVVDRDPRDCYLLEAAVWKTGVIPYKKVEDFCKWYKIIRRNVHVENEDKSVILRLNFEDLIYRYEDTISKIMQFIGIDSSHHKFIMEKFDPSVSINNTNLKQLYPTYMKEIEFIEKELCDYIYDFEKYSHSQLVRNAKNVF